MIRAIRLVTYFFFVWLIVWGTALGIFALPCWIVKLGAILVLFLLLALLLAILGDSR